MKRQTPPKKVRSPIIIACILNLIHFVHLLWRTVKLLAEEQSKLQKEKCNLLDKQLEGQYSSPITGEQGTCDVPPTTAAIAPLHEVLGRARSRVIPKELVPHFPKTINIPPSTLYHIEHQHFVCLTIGSRGDVQPYIALCIGLKKQGHQVTIVTHEEYKEWIEAFGINHSTAGGDPGALMKLRYASYFPFV
jgi:hypothetical protein